MRITVLSIVVAIAVLFCVPINAMAALDITINDASVVEGDAGDVVEAVFTVTMSRTATGWKQIQWRTQPGTATADVDYTSSGWTDLRFDPGETQKEIHIPILNDDLFELDETFTVDLQDHPTNPVQWGPAPTIVDNQGDGTIENDDFDLHFTVEDLTFDPEGTNPPPHNFSRAFMTVDPSQLPPSGYEFHVSYEFVDGTAVNPDDYADPLDGPPLIIIESSSDPTQTTRREVRVVQDDLAEDTETFDINITGVEVKTGNGVVVPGFNITWDDGLVTIMDDDPRICSIGDATIPEGDPADGPETCVEMTVTMEQPALGGEEVHLSLSTGPTPPTLEDGTDWTAPSPQLLTWTKGEVEKKIQVCVNTDLLFEADEIAQMRLWGHAGCLIGDTGTDNLGTLTVENDDYDLHFAVQDITFDPEGTNPPPFNFSREFMTVDPSQWPPAGFKFHIHYEFADGSATNPADYADPLDGPPLIILESSDDPTQTARREVRVVQDGIPEYTETFDINITDVEVYDPDDNLVTGLNITMDNGLVTIVDDDKVDMTVVNKVARLNDGSQTQVDEVWVGDDYAYRYTHRVDNLGPDTTAHVVITDPLPEYVVFMSATNGGIYDAGTHTVTWEFDDWEPNDPKWLRVEFWIHHDAPQGLELINTTCSETPSDADMDNNCASSIVTVRVPDVDYCCQFDSDRNVGVAPLLSHFNSLKNMIYYKWWLDLDAKFGTKEAHYLYWDVQSPTGKDQYIPRLAGPMHDCKFPDFVKVYEPGGYGHLQVVEGSPAPKLGWDNAVDGDTYWFNGTTMATQDETGKAWAIFEFTDQGTRNVSAFRMMTDTGIDRLKHQVEAFTVSVSTDGETFTEVLDAEKTNNVNTPCTLNDDWMQWDIEPVEAKYIKLVINEPSSEQWQALGEFEVWFETTLPNPAMSTMEVSGDQVTLTLKDADGNMVSGKTAHDIVIYSYESDKLHGHPVPHLAMDVVEDADNPGVYTATLSGHGTVKAAVNGVIIGSAEVAAMGDAQPAAQPEEKKAPNPEEGAPTEMETGDGEGEGNELVFVKGTPTYRKGSINYGWDNAIDGEIQGNDAMVLAHGATAPSDPAWAVFRFGDGEIYQFNYVTLQTDNGAADDGKPFQTIGFEVLVSTTGMEEDDFTSVLNTNRAGNGEMRYYNLGEYVQAKYIKLVLLTPSWTSNGWRQLVEFGVTTENKTGAVPAAAEIQFSALPNEFRLDTNYPNPFNPETTIRYHLKETRHVTLTIYDISGREVARLVDRVQPAGSFNVSWNAAQCPSGVYFYRLHAGSFQDVKRMILLK